MTFRALAGPVFITLLAIAAALSPASLYDTLAYDRYAVQGFELWRMLTANLLHTNTNHLLLNLAGLSLLWALHGDAYRFWRYMMIMVLCALATTLGILLFSPQLIGYVGLSGALHGLFVWGAIDDIRRKDVTGWFLLLGVVVKIAWEQWQGASDSMATLINASVAVDAHAYGALGGLVCALLIRASGQLPQFNTQKKAP